MLISSDTVTYNLFIRKLCLIEIVLTLLSSGFSWLITGWRGGEGGEVHGKASAQTAPVWWQYLP